jgi:hypothetical protein
VSLKRLTFVRRAPAVEPLGFGPRWRARAEQHHASAPPEARATRLVHCVVREGRTDRPFHGVAIEWFSDETNLAAHDRYVAAATSDDGLLDPAPTIRARVDERTVSGQEILDAWWRRADGGTRLLLLGVIQRKASLSRAEFADYWWSRHRPLANEMLPPSVQPPVYVHDYALEGEMCPWDGVGEFYDTAVDVARARTQWAETDEAAAIVADEERFLVRHTRYALITDAEVVVPTT